MSECSTTIQLLEVDVPKKGRQNPQSWNFEKPKVVLAVILSFLQGKGRTSPMAQHREVVDSSPAEYRDVQCSNPEVLELKGIQSGRGEFEDEPFGVGNNFGRNIHECPT